MSKLRKLIGSAFFVLLISVTSFAQDGIITGKVADASGAVLPGVTITVAGEQVMGQRTSITDETGGYRFTLLPPGIFSVKYDLPGFKTLVREGIQMSAGFTATINVSLEVGTVTETVTVEGVSPIIDVQSASVNTNFNPTAIAALPNGHDIFSVLAVTPGVQVMVPDVGGSEVRQRSSFRVYGSTSQWNVIDGAIVTSLLYQDPDSYAEMRFAAASKGAESPVAGSYNTFVIKSGGNKFHGLAFADWEPLKLQSSNLSQDLIKQGARNSNSIARYRAVHADVGGPIKKDKFWWFWGMRNINSDLNLIGFTDAQGNPHIARTTLQNQTAKLSYQLNSKNSLAYTMQWDRKYQPEVVTADNAAFVNTDSAPIQDNPEWVQSVVLNSVLSRTSTLEVRLGEFGWKFPRLSRVDEIARRDLDSQLVRGGYSSPSIDRSHHRNLDVVYSKNASTPHAGAHNIRLGYGYLWENAPYTRPSPKDSILQVWRFNFTAPLYIETVDTPFTIVDGSNQHSFFINDSWNFKKLTFNAGVRFDAFQPFYPQQGKTGAGPYQAQFPVAAFKFHWLTGLQPRLSLIYDIFGNGHTAVKLAFGKYVYNAGSITNAASTLAGQVNPMSLTTTRYDWSDGKLPFVPDPSKVISVTGGLNRRLDPNLTLPYTIEYMGGIDQELMRDMTARFTFVRKFERDRYQLLNTDIPMSAYNIPVAFTDPGRDGITGTADDQRLTLWSLAPAFKGKRADLLANDPANSASYTTFDFEIIKRFSKKWQMVTGGDVNQYKTWRFAVANGSDIQTDTTGRAQDPNLLAYNNGLNYWHWQYKGLGSYELPFGITSAATLRITKGEPYGRNLNTPALNQGVLTLRIEPNGAYFYPAVKLLDLRASKSFVLGESWGKVEGILDVFNVTNSSTVLSVNNLTGANFGKVLQTVNPRIARLGVRWTF